MNPFKIFSLENDDFINIACDNKFLRCLTHKFILATNHRVWSSLKEFFNYLYFDCFDHEIFWKKSLLLNHVIITKTNTDYWNTYEDKIKENYDLLTRGDIVMAISKKDIEIVNTPAKRDNIEIITGKYKKDKKYVVSTTLAYDCV